MFHVLNSLCSIRHSNSAILSVYAIGGCPQRRESGSDPHPCTLVPTARNLQPFSQYLGTLDIPSF